VNETRRAASAERFFAILGRWVVAFSLVATIEQAPLGYVFSTKKFSNMRLSMSLLENV
jgi:hypothetical protein